MIYRTVLKNEHYLTDIEVGKNPAYKSTFEHKTEFCFKSKHNTFAFMHDFIY